MSNQAANSAKDSNKARSFEPTHAGASQRELRLLATGIALTLMACAYLAVQNNRATAALELRRSRAVALAQDVRAIRSMRTKPENKSTKPNAATDILDSVNAAMQFAGLDPKSLISTQPQTARPIPGTDVADVEYRLIFNDVLLDSFARLAQACQSGPQPFRTTGIVLRAAPENRWNVDLLLSIREQSQTP